MLFYNSINVHGKDNEELKSGEEGVLSGDHTISALILGENSISQLRVHFQRDQSFGRTANFGRRNFWKREGFERRNFSHKSFWAL